MDGFTGSAFEELPEALVSDMLGETNRLSTTLIDNFKQVHADKGRIRDLLEKSGLLGHDADLIGTVSSPTVCAVDGSYAIEKLVSSDLVACAAVAVEGLAPPSEKRHWPRPRHFQHMGPVPHNSSNTVVCRAVMMTMELELCCLAPHDVVLFDGSLTTPLIYINQGLTETDPDPEFSRVLNQRIEKALRNYIQIITSPKNDQLYIGLPKYSQQREVGLKIGLPATYDDKALLTLLLNAGEFVGPLPLQEPNSRWHLSLPHQSPIVQKLGEELEKVFNNPSSIKVMYYKPNTFVPALRIELSESIAKNKSRLASLLQGIKYQCASQGIMEPYPNYLADRMVKHLSTAIPSIRTMLMQTMVEKNPDVPVGDILLSMHSYRTEGGR